MGPWIEARAPATVSNLGPGFDCLGMAVDGWQDRVAVRRGGAGGVRVVEVTGDPGVGAERLPTDAGHNTAGVAVAHLLRRLGSDTSLEIRVHKGLPLGSGLGSSGASAVAAVVAAAAALEVDVPAHALVEAARAAEAVACGAPHADNVAPAVLGGLVLVVPQQPLRLVQLPVPEGLYLAVYTPGCTVRTRDARAVLPEAVPLTGVVAQAARLGRLVHALHRGDLSEVGAAMVDQVAEPARAHLVPGFLAAKAAAYEAGALACGLSGAGPTVFALCADAGRARAILEILGEQFTLAGVPGRGAVCRPAAGAAVVGKLRH